MLNNPIPLRPAWVEVNLRAIENNTRRMKEIAGRDVDLLAVVKANGYGHGAIETSRAVVRGGATWLGVYTIGEGIELREAGIDVRILVLGPPHVEWVRAAIEHDLTLTVFSLDAVKAISNAACRFGKQAKAHLKIDTGMTRLGVSADSVVDFVGAAHSFSNIEIEGVFTHFAMADTPDAHGVAGWGVEYTQQQLARFNAAIRALEDSGISVRYRHCANSPATLNLPEARFNLVRSGILIYGLDPSDEVPRPSEFVPALAFKTQVAIVRDVPRGTYVGYGATFRTTRPSRIAVLMIGYADGFRRKPNNYGEVLVRGKRAPIVGRVAMDQTMVDVTDIDGVRAGDEVVLIGKQGAEEIRAEEVGNKLGTNNYEIITTISARLERRYV